MNASISGSVGSRITHDSALGHVAGTSRFLDDVAPLSGELELAVVGSPVACGRIHKLDARAALALPGVLAVYTHADIPGSDRMAPLLPDEPVLPEICLDYLDQPIAVVAAGTRRLARTAAAGVSVEVRSDEPILTLDQAVDSGVHVGEMRRLRRGDFRSAWEAAPHRREGLFYSGGQEHFYLESQSSLAWCDEEGSIRLLAATQNPSGMQAVVATVLGLPRHRVVCECRRMGGGFGGKETQSAIPACLAALVAHATGRPARLVYEASEDMARTGKRHPFRCSYSVAFDGDGRILALKADYAADGGAFNDLSTEIVGRALFHADNAYFIPHIELSAVVYRSNHPPNTAARGFGAPQAIASIENTIQEISQIVGRDALDVRRINLYSRSGDPNGRDTTPYGQRVDDVHLYEIIEELERTSDYRRRSELVASDNARSSSRLRGLALTPVKYGISFTAGHLNQANALVNVYADGSVQVSTGATEMGQGVNTKLRQLVADALGVGIEHVRVMSTSTEKNINTSPTAASVSADLNGAAAVDACAQIRGRLDGLARRHGEHLEFGALCDLAWRERIDLGARGFYATPRIHFDWNEGRGRPFFYYTCGAAVSEVEIDRWTGEIEVLRVDLIMDVGRSINPGIDDGQVIGGFVQGMGWCTTEELVYDERGALLTDSASTYKIPSINDVPRHFHASYRPCANPLNVAGSRAVGEPPLLLGISVWAAIKNALSTIDPSAIPPLRLPATGEHVLAVLTSLEAPESGDDGGGSDL